MDFRVTEDQEALREGVRSFCEGRLPFESLAALASRERGGFDAELWKELVELGVFSLRLPEAEGGVGLGSAEAVLVFAELGRRLVPGPVIWSHLAAGLVPGAADGTTVVGGLERLHHDSEPLLLEHLKALDVLIVLRSTGVFRVDPKALAVQPVTPPTDPLTPLHHVASLPEGERLGSVEDAMRLRRDGAALAAAFSLGLAEEALAQAVAYAKERHQFGRPIGSFQAMQHMMADMFVRQEKARAAVYAAGATLDDPRAGDPVRAVAAAKLLADEAAERNARACIQIHGGMGFTWEMPPHYILKRAWVLERVFGDGAEHAAEVAARLEAGLASEAA